MITSITDQERVKKAEKLAKSAIGKVHRLEEELAEGGGGTSSNSYLTGILELDNDQIKALGDSQVEVIPAPGAGKINVFHGAILLTKYVADYTNVSNGNGEFAGFTNPTEDDVWSSYIVSPFWNVLFAINFSNAPYVYFPPMALVDGGTVRTDVQSVMTSFSNQPIVLMVYNGGLGAFTGGHADNKWKIKVWYTVEDLPA